jgi:hypothetical protein
MVNFSYEIFQYTRTQFCMYTKTELVFKGEGLIGI